MTRGSGGPPRVERGKFARPWWGKAGILKRCRLAFLFHSFGKFARARVSRGTGMFAWPIGGGHVHALLSGCGASAS